MLMKTVELISDIAAQIQNQLLGLRVGLRASHVARLRRGCGQQGRPARIYGQGCRWVGAQAARSDRGRGIYTRA